MLKKVFTICVTAVALTGGLLVGEISAPFSQLPQADAFEMVCPDGTQPTCNPIFNGSGRVIGYTCLCG